MQPQTQFIFLIFNVYSDTNTMELSNEVLLSETKIKSSKHQHHKGIFVPEKGKYIASFFFDVNILRSS